MERLRKAWSGLGVFAKDYVVTEVVLPLNPILIEWLLKTYLPFLGAFTLWDKSLAASAMIVPLISYIKTPKESPLRWLFGGVIIAGVVLFVVCIFLASDATKRDYLIGAYKCCGGGVGITLAFGGLSNLWANSLAHLFQKQRPASVPVART